jgi:hypothetical protein
MGNTFEEEKTVQTLSAQLSWSHFVKIIYIKDSLQRQFYAEPGRSWSPFRRRSRITWIWSSGTHTSWTSWGRDFSFIARQKRMTARERDFYLDLDGVFVDFTISELAISPSISDIMVTSLVGMRPPSW